MKIIETLAQVTGERFVAGIVLQGRVDADRDQDRVVEAAPIVRRQLKNKSRQTVRQIAQERRWRVAVVWQMERELP